MNDTIDEHHVYTHIRLPDTTPLSVQCHIVGRTGQWSVSVEPDQMFATDPITVTPYVHPSEASGYHGAMDEALASLSSPPDARFAIAWQTQLEAARAEQRELDRKERERQIAKRTAQEQEEAERARAYIAAHPEQVITAYKCEACGSLSTETAAAKLYECGECGEKFTRNISEYDSHRCSCGKFASVLADDACAECEAGEVEEVQAYEDEAGELVEVPA